MIVAVAAVFSVLGVGISLIALFFTWTNNKAILSLEEAEVILEQVEIKSSTNPKDCKDVGEDKFCNLITTPKLKNIGESSAEDVGLEYWICTLEQNVVLTKDGNRCEEQRSIKDTRTSNPLPPHTYAQYTQFDSVMEYTEMSDADITKSLKQERLLVFLLEYHETLNDVRKQTLYMYRHVINDPFPLSVAQREYGELHPYLLSEVERYDSKSEFAQYLRRNPPK